MERELGSIEAGKIADLVNSDRNSLDPAVADEELSDIKVFMTWVGGTKKFTEAKFAESQGLPQVGYRGSFID